MNNSELQLPEEAPVMALPNALLLPFALIPLSIFEERYRALVRHALEHDRMFCVALMKPEPQEEIDESLAPDLNPFEPPFSHSAHSPLENNLSSDEEMPLEENIFPTVGIGLIRACVTLPNGNSNLILQGIARVGLTGWKQHEPFRIAHIQPLPNQEAESQEAEALSAQVLELCHELKDRGTHVPVPIEKQLAAIRDPSALADIVSHTFIADPFTRQKLLEELSVPTRLRHLISQLQTELLG